MLLVCLGSTVESAHIKMLHMTKTTIVIVHVTKDRNDGLHGRLIKHSLEYDCTLIRHHCILMLDKLQMFVAVLIKLWAVAPGGPQRYCGKDLSSIKMLKDLINNVDRNFNVVRFVD